MLRHVLTCSLLATLLAGCGGLPTSGVQQRSTVVGAAALAGQASTHDAARAAILRTLDPTYTLAGVNLSYLSGKPEYHFQAYKRSAGRAPYILVGRYAPATQQTTVIRQGLDEDYVGRIVTEGPALDDIGRKLPSGYSLSSVNFLEFSAKPVYTFTAFKPRNNFNDVDTIGGEYDPETGRIRFSN